MSEFKLEVGQVFKVNLDDVDYTFEVVKIDEEKDAVYSKTDFAPTIQYKGLLPHSIDVFTNIIAENGKNLIK